LHFDLRRLEEHLLRQRRSTFVPYKTGKTVAMQVIVDLTDGRKQIFKKLVF
jgi:hypothetical protein